MRSAGDLRSPRASLGALRESAEDEEGEEAAEGGAAEAEGAVEISAELEMLGLVAFQLRERLGAARRRLGQHQAAGEAFQAAADEAMAAGKGKLAARMVEAAEAEWALCEEEE